MIAKLKAQQNSQQSKPVEAVKSVKQETAPVEIPKEYDEEEEIDAQELPKDEKDPKDEKVQQILMEIEMLQNNGRFRAELLNQLNEINKALVVIAGALANLSDVKK